MPTFKKPQKGKNPWENIKDEYFEHMSNPQVAQTQALNDITEKQYKTCSSPEKIIIFGIADGNGLEHVDENKTTDVYGIDINQNFLDKCRDKYNNKKYKLHLQKIDINHENINLPKMNLIIANLFLEYVDLSKFISITKKIINNDSIISIIIQKNNENDFVSETEHSRKLEKELGDHHQNINKKELIDFFKKNNLNLTKEEITNLPNNKEFIRLDFQKI